MVTIPYYACLRITRPPPQDNWVWNKFWSIVGDAGSYALLTSSVVAASLSCASVAVILLLYTARVFTPIEAHVVRPLYFDFTQPQAVATVNLLSAEPHTHYVHDLHEFRAKVRAAALRGRSPEHTLHYPHACV